MHQSGASPLHFRTAARCAACVPNLELVAIGAFLRRKDVLICCVLMLVSQPLRGLDRRDQEAMPTVVLDAGASQNVRHRVTKTMKRHALSGAELPHAPSEPPGNVSGKLPCGISSHARE